MINDLDRPLLSVRDVAEALTISPRAARRLLADGHLSYIQITGNCRRVTPDDLEALMAAHYFTGTTSTACGSK